MSAKSSERRLAENEVVFRSYNEQAQKSLDKLNQAAYEEGEQPYDFDTSMPLHFYCECADETCQKRIVLSLDEYNRIHTANDMFVIACGHEVTSVERIVDSQPTYCVVQKYKQPPRSAKRLNRTDVHNA